MVRCSDGTIVSVMIGNEAVPEYQIEETRSGLVRTTTCYIEAKEGDEFQVRVSNYPVEDDQSQSAKVFMDGKLADIIVDCLKSTSLTFKGYKMVTSSAQGIYRAFSFGKMQTTNDDSVKKLPGAELQDVCTIRLEITPRKKNGPTFHLPMMQKHFAMPAPSVQHEESKSALWGLSAQPGRTFYTAPMYTCNCEVVDDPDALRHVVTFKYFSHQWLVMKGIKECSQDDDEVAIDARRTDRTAVRRRGRLELLPWGRNIRIKGEGATCDEAITIKDEADAVKGQRIMMELTADGEYVPASRSLGGVIVIEDD